MRSTQRPPEPSKTGEKSEELGAASQAASPNEMESKTARRTRAPTVKLFCLNTFICLRGSVCSCRGCWKGDRKHGLPAPLQ